MELYIQIQDKLNYWVAIILIMLGLWAMIGKRNLIKKLVGMVIFQSAIILFFVSMSVKQGATIPILAHNQLHGSTHSEHAEVTSHNEVEGTSHSDTQVTTSHNSIDPDVYDNPLPHVLMLTAIVVGVATLGVALAIVLKLYEGYGTIEEDEIDKRIRLALKEDEEVVEGGTE